jgi:hypothetical protein
METRLVTIDIGEDRNVVMSLQTQASPAEIIAAARTLGYIVFPAGALRRQAGEEARLSRDAYVLSPRLVQVE